MTVQEIEKSIEGELLSFNVSKYFGTLPKDFIANFKKALLEIAPNVHQLKVKVIKDILSKKEAELSFMEVGMMINIIQAAPLYVLSDDLDSALTKFERIEKLRIEWNTTRGNKEAELLQKKQTMLKLASGNNGQVRMIAN